MFYTSAQAFTPVLENANNVATRDDQNPLRHRLKLAASVESAFIILLTLFQSLLWLAPLKSGVSLYFPPYFLMPGKQQKSTCRASWEPCRSYCSETLAVGSRVPTNKHQLCAFFPPSPSHLCFIFVLLWLWFLGNCMFKLDTFKKKKGVCVLVPVLVSCLFLHAELWTVVSGSANLTIPGVMVMTSHPILAKEEEEEDLFMLGNTPAFCVAFCEQNVQWGEINHYLSKSHVMDHVWKQQHSIYYICI